MFAFRRVNTVRVFPSHHSQIPQNDSKDIRKGINLLQLVRKLEPMS